MQDARAALLMSDAGRSVSLTRANTRIVMDDGLLLDSRTSSNSSQEGPPSRLAM